MQNRIDAALTAAERDAVLAALQTVRDALPFLQAIPAGERRRLRRMGLGSRGFVEAANTAARQFSDALPRSMDTTPFDRDLELLRAFEPVVQAVADLHGRVMDTWTLLGSDAMKASEAVYHYLSGHPNVDGQSEVMQMLRARYDGQGRRRAPAGGGTPPVA